MGNFSRDTFDKLKHYVGVRLQQGVPIVDADWNEQEDIRKYELQAFLKWFVGNGVPAGNNGFRIRSSPDSENDFRIQDGICLVEGWDVINDRELRYTRQPLYEDDTMALTIPETPRTDTVYLDVWEREVNATEDRNLINEAIGIETCVRLKREWVVRVAEGKELSLPPEGHVYYPLASLRRPAGEAVIRERDITDLRQTGLNLAALDARVSDHDHSGGDQGKPIDTNGLADAAVTYEKIRFEVVKRGSVTIPGVTIPDGKESRDVPVEADIELGDDPRRIYIPALSITTGGVVPIGGGMSEVTRELVHKTRQIEIEIPGGGTSHGTVYDIDLRITNQGSKEVTVAWCVYTFAGQ